MAYKSNKEARAEYLANEQKNREVNQQRYARSKKCKSSNAMVRAILLIALVLFLLSRLGHHWLTAESDRTLVHFNVGASAPTPTGTGHTGHAKAQPGCHKQRIKLVRTRQQTQSIS
jgi:hypothetical protein